ncbi:MAG: nucleoside triphosphate pyrophosphohydrolase [Clostridiales bacterium]|nr:nucleoside triphosphate pyrophosphohydrolase [Clostridiales bacterium]
MKITLIGLGVKDGDISLAGYQSATCGKKVFLRTALSVCGKAVLDRGINAIPLDFVYEKSKNFDTLSRNLAKEVLSASKTEEVVYLVDGDVVDDVSCSIIIKKHKDVEIIPCVSKASYFASKVGLSGGYQSSSAYDIEGRELTLPLVVYDIDNSFIASKVKLAISDRFGDEIPCYKFFNGNFKKIKIYELDFETEFDYSSAIVIDALPLIEKTRFSLDDLHEIVKVLRSENGCPWDRAQTKESIRQDVIEEAYELVDAINREDEAGMCEESGDLILQAVFSTVFAEERKCFTLRDAVSGICQKLIERHTHIFGTDKATNAENALEIWDKNKQKEKGFQTGGEYLESVPFNLPALIRAQKVGSRAKKSNMDFSDANAVFEKVLEELNEVKAELTANNKDTLISEVGDLLFAIVSLARLSGFSAEEALTLSTDKFIERFKKTENLILKDGKDMKSLSAEEIDQYYNESKKY